MTERQPMTQESLDEAVEKLDTIMNLFREVRNITGVMRIASCYNVHLNGCIHDVEKLSDAISEFDLEEEEESND